MPSVCAAVKIRAAEFSDVCGRDEAEGLAGSAVLDRVVEPD